MDWNLFSSGSYCAVPNNEAPDRRATLEAFVRRTDGHAAAITGGEWRRARGDSEQDWLVGVCYNIFSRLSLVTSKAIEGRKYWHFVIRKLLGLILAPLIWIRAATGAMPELPYHRWHTEDGPDIDAVRGSARKMRGVPTAKALKFFSGLPLLGGFMEKRVANQVKRILEDDPETIIDFELPAELAFVSLSFLPSIKRWTARRMAKSLERVIRQCPKGSRFAFHLCWGDLNHRPFVPKWLQSNKSKVILITELVLLGVWIEGWNLFGIHDPMCDGTHNASHKEEDYADYDNLPYFPPGVIFALGILKAGNSVGNVVSIAKFMAKKLKRKDVTQFCLAPPCGDARTPQDEVDEHWQIGREAIERLNAA
jgi:hypothetical protein